MLHLLWGRGSKRWTGYPPVKPSVMAQEVDVVQAAFINQLGSNDLCRIYILLVIAEHLIPNLEAYNIDV